MKPSSLLRPERLILLLAALSALPPLLDAWLHAPLEKLSGIGFLLWILPALRAAVWSGRAEPEGPAGDADEAAFPLCSALALPALAAGALLDVNVLNHAALALAIAGFVFVHSGRTAGGWCWLLCAVAWMPATGWLAAEVPAGLASGFRLLAGAGGAAACLLSTRPANPPPATLP